MVYALAIYFPVGNARAEYMGANQPAFDNHHFVPILLGGLVLARCDSRGDCFVAAFRQ
jgi:hypothetical protein